MFKRVLYKFLGIIINWLSVKQFINLIFRLINYKVLRIDNKDGMRLLFDLDNKLYSLQGRTAIKCNGGVHPKHYILKYKEWFCDNIEKDWVVLDVGCNTGMMPEVMSDKAKYVYGIEIEEKHIEEAKLKRQKDNIEFICADATTYDYSVCKPVDCITLSNVLEHIDERVDFLKKLIHQVKWSDDRDKILLIRVPVIDRDWRVLYKRELGCDWRLDSTHFTEYTTEEFYNEMKEAGIEVEEFERRFGEIYAVCKAPS